MPGPDLHVHSTASDGQLAPAELVALAARLGLPAIALTDHDTVDGIAAALTAAETLPVTVIPGVELSAAVGERSVHILGYFIDHSDEALLARLARLREVRIERAHAILAALASGGIQLSIDDVLAAASDGGAVGRAHIAGLLVEAGHAVDVPDAFRRLLGRGAPYYVPKPVMTPREVVGWITSAGGIAVAAHPGLSEIDDLVPALAEDGIVGLEAYHGAHDEAARGHYAALASEHGLVATGGSDFHGSVGGPTLGSAHVPEEAADALRQAWERRRR